MNPTTPRHWRVAILSGSILLALLVLPQLGRASGLCGPWEGVPTPNVGTSVTRLTAVTALSATDAWAVGYWRNEPAGSGPLALRWEGTSWSEAELPETGHLGTMPLTEGVTSLPNGDVWIVGNVTTTYPTHNRPLVMRWREGAWDIAEAVTLRPQTEYPYADRGGFAYEVDALGENDVWAVGQAAGYGDAQSASVPMAIHWDGSEWMDVEVPLVANRHHQLNDLVAIAPDDVWAVGDYRNIAGAFRGVTYHWDGGQWSHVHSPIEEILQSGLEDIAATGPDDVWAIGGSDAGVVLMHWDGFQWELREPPPDSGGSLAAVGPNDLWASGWHGYWHWDGSAWCEVPVAVPGASYVIRSGGIEIVGACDLWCMGFWTLEDGITSFTLAERLRPSPAAVPAAIYAREVAAISCPSPFRPGDLFRFTVPASSQATLTLHDLQGRALRSIPSPSPGGEHSRSVSWDGRTDAGESLPTGIYFARLEAGGASATRSVAFVGPSR